ncbi:MAG: MFS transporter [SAR92 bacterium BACL26 MAG-121220-bin70]|uniref:MFS transporter n=1 Tax=SAR92 bacterium BACL26 MAG-121220-bin70 TaxID=1655626 RepID=A0A0R2U0I0_9GAMM|nr:MAG: MFS transporter [SAR92 bacterium BACL26 MAG-121220-bin70]
MGATLTSYPVFSPIERRATFSIASLYAFRMLGLFMVLPVLAFSVVGYPDYSPLLLGLTLGAYGLVQAILQIPLGLLSDRVGRRPVIIGGLLMFIFGSIVCAVVETMEGLILGRALQGAGAIASTLMAMVTDLTSEENRTKAMAMIGGSIGFSFILAMVLGPLITLKYGLSGIFWMTAILGALGVLIVLVLVPRRVEVQHNRETSTDLKQIVRLIKQTTLLRLNYGIFALHLALMAAFVAIPTILSDELGIEAQNLWWVYLLLLGGGFFIMLPGMIIAEKHNGQKWSFLVSVGAMMMATLALSLYRGPIMTPVLLLIFFTAFNLLEASLPSWMSKSCPVGNRGTAMGIYSTSQFLGAFFGGLLGGWSLQMFGVNGLFMVISFILALWWLVCLGLKSPRPLKTLVLTVGELEHTDFTKIVSNIAGVEDILLLEGERLAYVQVDRLQVDMSSLQPYLNR